MIGTMKLEYLDDISEGGKYKQVVSENLIRLYHPEEGEAEQLIILIKRHLIDGNGALDLSTLNFIQSLNCRLTLEVSTESEGVIKITDDNTFVCRLTKPDHEDMIEMIELVGDGGGYNWLCETSEQNIDFLYSPGGTW